MGNEATGVRFAETIARGMAKQARDYGALRLTRADQAGRLPDPTVRSYFPYFFTRDGATISLTGQYRGASAFLVASGPSFNDIPKEELRKVWAMTLNNASTSYRGQANCTVDDPSRFNLSMWMDPTIQKFVPLSHFEKPLWDNRYLRENGEGLQKWERSAMRVGDCPNVVGYRRNEKFDAAQWLQEDSVNWGNHKKYGGGRSVMLAALRILFLLGFRRVYLLGVDFDMSAETRYHFDEERSGSAVRGNNTTYAKLQQRFAELQPYFLQAGFVVKNCNPNSRLEAFPKMGFSEAIDEATRDLGSYSEERTNGMYVKLSEKEAAVPKQQIQSGVVEVGNSVA